MTVRLRGQDLVLQYDDRVVVENLDFDLPDGSFTVIIGPNACGKSTLLRGLARILRPHAGSVVLDGKTVASMPTKAVARTVGVLPQTALAPDATTVEDLVGRGRYPHLRPLRQWSVDDQDAVEEAMRATSVTDLADRPINELSGGQRQRAWLAMVLAQQTPLLLLDEPTTFLDLAHQVEVLDLCADLVADGRTVLAVLHDLNLAFRYATHLVCMAEGRITASGTPEDVVTPELLARTFGLRCAVVPDPLTGRPMVVPVPRTAPADAG